MSAPIKTVMVTEANQKFSRLIQEVERDGVSFRILRRDRPIALLVPETEGGKAGEERKAAIAEMKRLLQEGISLGREHLGREDFHDRS